jgi:catalase
MAITPEQAIDTVNEAFGRHPGHRAVHAAGALLTGTFVASPGASGLSRAGHLTGETIPATFRFSNASGDPEEPDGKPDSRGLGIKLYLPDGSRTDIVAVTSPLFPVATPEAFIEFVKAQSAPWKLPLFLATHRRALALLPKLAPTLQPPRSYATIPYYALHAYKWLDADGGERWVRYTLVPEVSEPRLKPWQTRGLAPDYLRAEIAERVTRGPVRFTLEVVIATPGDPTDDPSAAWPAGRRRVAVGTFEITGPETQRETDGDVLVFDPTRVVDGIELSDDPVLRFRKAAYSESVRRRTSG